MSDLQESAALPGDHRSVRNRRTVKRRQVVRLGLGMAGGIALGSTYVSPRVVSVGIKEAFAVTPVPGGSIDVTDPTIAVQVGPVSMGASSMQATGSFTVTNVSGDTNVMLSIQALSATVVAVAKRGATTTLSSSTTFSPGVGTQLPPFSPQTISFSSTFSAPSGTKSIRITVSVTAGGVTRTATGSHDIS